MKITNVKAILTKGVTVALLAGAVALAAPAKANAAVVVGVGVGAPYYGYGYYGRPGYFERRRIEEARRHEAWVRAHEYNRYHHDHYRGW
jgi:hypothetical protein